ncbi:MAG: ribbon-helix-helix domain-containing protein [Opitutaceae bacterium]|jgi:Arc/MetJ-type ribon-helix-helix transcriptional regulator|nr:ribbon-helix-helix domain-containing protein [Opitutaceae bacterium]
MPLRPQINARLPEPLLADIKAIMESRGIRHLSDYIRQLITADVRQFHEEEYAAGRKDPEFQEWLLQKRVARKHSQNKPPSKS